MSTENDSIAIDRDIGNFFYNVTATRDAGVGLTEKTIDYIVDVKGEPEWLRAFRKNAYNVFLSKPLPTHWAGDELKEIDFDKIRYYLASAKPPSGRGKRFLRISSAPSKDWASLKAKESSWRESKLNLTAKLSTPTSRRPSLTRE